MVSLDLILLMLAVGAAAMLILVRPSLIKRLHEGPDLVSGHNKLVGKQGVVTEELSALNPGRVKVGGEIWSACPYAESLTIAPGATVEVFAIRGATAYVHPVGELMP